MNEIRNRIVDARCRIQVREYWYGAFSSRFDWTESKQTKTMGVSAHGGGRILCHYNKEWCNTLSIDELIAVIIHEIEHVVRLHICRSPTSSASDRHLFNIAADWVINGPYNRPRIKNLPRCGVFIPCQDDPTWVGYDLTDITEDMTAEQYFDWLKKLPSLPKNLAPGDDHDLWSRSDATADETRQMVKELARSATSIAGTAPGGLTTSIAALDKPQHNWIAMLRNFVGRHIGSSRSTFSRPNRRFRRFGIKGYSSHGSVPLTIFLDRSGSVQQSLLQRFFTEIEAMSQRFKITLIIFDTSVVDVISYHRGDWKKIKLGGGGGTDFECALKHAEENDLIGKANIFLTDGECTIPDKREYPLLWAVCARANSPVFDLYKNAWGTLVPIFDKP